MNLPPPVDVHPGSPLAQTPSSPSIWSSPPTPLSGFPSDPDDWLESRSDRSDWNPLLNPSLFSPSQGSSPPGLGLPLAGGTPLWGSNERSGISLPGVRPFPREDSSDYVPQSLPLNINSFLHMEPEAPEEITPTPYRPISMGLGLSQSLPNHTSQLQAVPVSGEHPHGEHPSRTLFVRNINSSVDDYDLRNLFERFGSIRKMYTQCKHRGFVMISYYDIRDAKNAMRHLQGKEIRRRKIDIHYSIPKDNPSEKDQNQGTLVVFNVDPTVTMEEMMNKFREFGEVKEVRETPNKKHHRFVEYYDLRDAEKALKALNKTEIRGKKIKIEASRPGGARKSPDLSRTPEMGKTSWGSLGSKSKGSESEYRTSPRKGKAHTPSSYSNNRRNRSQSQNDSNFILSVEQVKNGSDKRTTLMIRNIPNKYSQKMLLQAADVNHKGRYDFFYLPIDFKNKCNVGYAFVNMIDPSSIIPFYEEFHNKKWGMFNSEKICAITYARIQGKHNLIAHFQNSSLMCEDKKCRPIIFHSDGPQKGQMEPFPVGPNVRVRRKDDKRKSRKSAS